MILLCFRKLGGGIGRRLCMPTYSGQSDSVFKEKKFILKRINHKYENVLLFGDVNKLRSTAAELIKEKPRREYLYKDSQKNFLENDTPFDNFMKNKILQKKLQDSTKESFKKESENEETESHELQRIDKTYDKELESISTEENKNKGESSIRKKLSFWQIYSMRVKKSLHILNYIDLTLILHSFHVHNKDTGIYVSCVNYVEKQIGSLNGSSYVLLLSILSLRLKKHSYKSFFQKMLNHLPNVLFELNIKDMCNILSCFINIDEHTNRTSRNNPCDIMYKKIINQLNIIDCNTLVFLCDLFDAYNFENYHFFKCLKNRGIDLLDEFDALSFYQFVFILHKKKINIDEIISMKKEDIISFLPSYDDEQKKFICKLFNL